MVRQPGKHWGIETEMSKTLAEHCAANRTANNNCLVWPEFDTLASELREKVCPKC